MKKWENLDSSRIFECRIFNVRKDRNSSPITHREHDFFVMEAPNWVNVIALTPNGETVLIEQYRHGVRDVTLEIPGGTIDEGEMPEEAARRELREETGFEAERWIPLGVVQPNPAIQENLCYTFLADQARRVDDQMLDHTEEIEVRLVPLEQIPRLISDNQISHALVVSAFYYYDLFKNRRE